MMSIRRAVMANEPQLKSASGNPLTIFTPMSARMPSALVTYNATQSGSGTPSPNNVRQINAFSQIALTVSPTADPGDGTTVSQSYATARSRGSLDLVTGEMWDFARRYTLDNSGWNAVGSKFYHTISDADFASCIRTEEECLCNMYPFAGIITSGSAAVTEDKHFYLQRVSGYNRVWVYDTDFTLTQFNALLGETALQFTYPVTMHAYLTTHDIETLVGMNYITTNGTNIDIQYWTI